MSITRTVQPDAPITAEALEHAYLEFVRDRALGRRPARTPDPRRAAAFRALGVGEERAGCYALSPLTPEQAQPYLAVAASVRTPWGRAEYEMAVPEMVHIGLDAVTTATYIAMTIGAQDQIRLHRLGATPRMLANRARIKPLTPTALLVRAFEMACRACGGSAVPIAVFACGGTTSDAIDWNGTGETPERIARFVLAGVGIDEWGTTPGIREADDAALDAMAAVRGRRAISPGSLAVAPTAGLVSA